MRRFDAFMERLDRPLKVVLAVCFAIVLIGDLTDGKFDAKDVVAIVLVVLGAIALLQRRRQGRPDRRPSV